MRIVTTLIKDLVTDPANTRRHGERNLETIKASLLRFGQQKPIVVDAAGVVVAGNGTLEAARALGWKKIAIVRTGLEGANRAAYGIADNRTAELAEWDDTALAEMLAELKADGVPGYTDDEIEELITEAIDPSFGAVGEDTQGRLDEKTKVRCPECGHEFTT